MIDFDYELAENLTITPLPNVILVHNMEHGEYKTASGVIIPDDNGKERGIKSRWGIVYSVGNAIDYVKPGDSVLVSHGRWSRGIKIKQQDGTFTTIRRVDPNDILLVKDKPN